MARKKGGGHGGGEERWLLTYSDLITLLLAFFIILYSGSKADLEKFGKLAQSFQATFGMINVLGTGGGAGEGVLESGSDMFDFGQLPATQRQFMGLSEKLETYATEKGLGDQIAVNMRAEGVAITLSNALLFPSGGVELPPEAQATLAKIAEMIRPLPNDVRIEAHTDNLATNSPVYPTNWELSTARAAAVARYLIEKENIAGGRLSALGFGEYRPLYPNDTREHRLLNRRADILILFPSAKVAPSVDLMAGN
jgi:chemotaxis protein MotB